MRSVHDQHYNYRRTRLDFIPTCATASKDIIGHRELDPKSIRYAGLLILFLSLTRLGYSCTAHRSILEVYGNAMISLTNSRGTIAKVIDGGHLDISVGWLNHSQLNNIP
jgi:hypothetical protein